MNKSPMNYLITAAAGVILWFITAIPLAGVIGNGVSLSSMSIEEFLVWYRKALSIASLSAIINLFYWYYYGGSDKSAGDSVRSKSIWNISFISQIVIAGVILVVLVLMLLKQGISTGYYGIIFGLASLHSYLFFWICSLVMSPPNVQYSPLGKR